MFKKIATKLGRVAGHTVNEIAVGYTTTRKVAKTTVTVAKASWVWVKDKAHQHREELVMAAATIAAVLLVWVFLWAAFVGIPATIQLLTVGYIPHFATAGEALAYVMDAGQHFATYGPL